ncbi:hypothetical protein ACJ41O_002432 [Fusarium nematophilum]
MKSGALNQTAIIAALRGQTLRIPNPRALFRPWPPAQLHRHHEHIAPIVNGAFDRMAAAHPLIAHRKQDDIARLTAFWYPQAQKRQLRALALYTAWLVGWDDAVDANEGDLARDFTRAERWRRRTLDVVRRALDVDVDDGVGARAADRGDDAVNAVFWEFGIRYRDAAPADQRRRLHDEIRGFITSCAVEQQLRLDRRIPDFDSYMAMRLGTVGGTMLCSLVPYATQEELPAAVASAPEVRRLWTQASVLLSLLNNLLSLKKELRTECVINAVTALMKPGAELDDVVADMEKRMWRAVEEFDDAARKLIKIAGPNEELKDLTGRYVDGCRAVVTGTLEFMLVNPWNSLNVDMHADTPQVDISKIWHLEAPPERWILGNYSLIVQPTWS